MAVIYLPRSDVEDISESGIRELIQWGKYDYKYRLLDGYYKGEHSILQHNKKDRTLPNNKIVNNMAKYVTDTAVGYFIGKPVVYSSSSSDLAYLERLQDIFNYNDEQDHNTELAKKQSITGHGFEMLYTDEDARLRLGKLAPGDVTMIYEGGFETPIAAIRSTCFQRLDRSFITLVEFWNWREVWRFQAVGSGKLQLTGVEEHFWEDIPFVEYVNNEERMGDFEGIVSIIDAYNKVQSNTANLFQYNDEAILKVLGLGDVTAADIKDMKEKGAIILENGGNLEWLLKVVNDTALENYKDRLFRDMHIFAGVPDLSDESFGNNLSGVAVSYKLWNLEQICAIKERKYKKGLQRRVELITRYLNIQGGNYDYRDIEMQFRRNKPQNLLELAQIFVMLVGEVSKETRLKMLPLIENVQDELEKLARERKDELDDFGGIDNILKAIDDLEALKQADDSGEELA